MSNEYTTWNYVLSFKGWAQCRMATDPDPANEPRGVSGYSFALPGEVDFNRICYFQQADGVINRSKCPPVGVFVTGGRCYTAKVFDDGQEQFQEMPQPIDAKHQLFGAAIDLLHDPIFDSRNSTLVYDGYGILTPFELQVKATDCDGKEITVSRSYDVDPQNPTAQLQSIPIDQLEQHVMSPAIYNSANSKATEPGSIDILLESGVLDPVAYRQQRLRELEAQRCDEKDAIKLAALDKRIAELRIDDPVNRRTAQLGSKVLLPYNLNSRQATVNCETIHDAGELWPLELWMGAWDTDALNFFVMGTVKIVLPFDLLNR